MFRRQIPQAERRRKTKKQRRSESFSCVTSSDASACTTRGCMRETTLTLTRSFSHTLLHGNHNATFRFGREECCRVITSERVVLLHACNRPLESSRLGGNFFTPMLHTRLQISADMTPPQQQSHNHVIDDGKGCILRGRHVLTAIIDADLQGSPKFSQTEEKMQQNDGQRRN